ncbi:hypothetical protein CEXT_258241 [Caerostris extrusa]|uniref:Uncharacterized protein n=1 Tax=Caerostris extrusa TaxID=172846 RepID=A0AAV4P373_CAEEX|nr:hypothetical protein CEXT_258241 [Caerostris extrusa]
MRSPLEGEPRSSRMPHVTRIIMQTRPLSGHAHRFHGSILSVSANAFAETEQSGMYISLPSLRKLDSNTRPYTFAGTGHDANLHLGLGGALDQGVEIQFNLGYAVLLFHKIPPGGYETRPMRH